MSTQPTQESKEVVEQFFEGLDSHNPDIMDELIAEDVTTGIYRSGSEEDINSREDMKHLWNEYWTAFPDLVGASTEFVTQDNRVAVFRKEEGTHEGEFRGIAPTGKQITFEYSGFLDVEDGQIVHCYFHGDILNLLKQLGVESPISG